MLFPAVPLFLLIRQCLCNPAGAAHIPEIIIDEHAAQACQGNHVPGIENTALDTLVVDEGARCGLLVMQDITAVFIADLSMEPGDGVFMQYDVIIQMPPEPHNI